MLNDIFLWRKNWIEMHGLHVRHKKWKNKTDYQQWYVSRLFETTYMTINNFSFNVDYKQMF